MKTRSSCKLRGFRALCLTVNNSYLHSPARCSNLFKMAVQMQQPQFILPEKFEKMGISRFVSEDTMSVPSTPSTPTSPGPEPYAIKTVTEEDSEPVLDFLRTFFFKDEPLNVAVKLIEFKDSTCVELEQYSVKSIKDGTSVMAVTSSGKIIGVCLNGKMDKDEPEEDDDDCPNPKFAKILKLLNYAGDEGTKIIAQKYPDVDKVMFVKILSVDGTWRGKGIAKQLMDLTRNIVREQGYGLMRVDCSSYFSARAIARLGFDRVYELKYADYKENGKAVFDPEPPHAAFAVYVQRISSCQTP